MKRVLHRKFQKVEKHLLVEKLNFTSICFSPKCSGYNAPLGAAACKALVAPGFEPHIFVPGRSNSSNTQQVQQVVVSGGTLKDLHPSNFSV